MFNSLRLINTLSYCEKALINCNVIHIFIGYLFVYVIDAYLINNDTLISFTHTQYRLHI